MLSRFDSTYKPLKVKALAWYPSWDWHEVAYRDEDYAANFFTHAIKGDRAKIGSKYQWLPIGEDGAKVYINADNISLVRKFFADWAARMTKAEGISDPIFIPIPNRDGLVDARDFKSAFLARKAAQAFGPAASEYTGLRFKNLVPKESGKRQPAHELIANMTLTSPVKRGTIVLVDDVFTLGQHLSAATAVLPRRPALALVASITTKEPKDRMLDNIEHYHYC